MGFMENIGRRLGNRLSRYAEKHRRAGTMPDGGEGPEDITNLELTDDQMPARGLGKSGGLLFAALFWCGITSIFVFFDVSMIVKSLYAQVNFSRIDGTVIESKVTTSRDDDGDTHKPLIRYKYEVDGKTYENDDYDFCNMSSSDMDYSSDIVGRHSSGKAVTVYYNPDNPSDAVLSVEVPPLAYLLSLFLQPFIIVGLGLICAVFVIPRRSGALRDFLRSRPRPPCDIPTWGSLQMDANGYIVKPSAGVLKRLMAFAIGYGITCFFAIFINVLLFASLTGLSATPLIISFTLAVVIGLAAVALCGRLSRFNTSLRLDTVYSHVELSGPRRDVRVKFADITAWTIEMIPNPRKARDEGDRRTVPLLSMRTAKGDVPVHVFGAKGEAPQIAIRTGQIFASLTGRPLLSVPQDEGRNAPKSITEAVNATAEEEKLEDLM